jgi:hypothetical protein
VDRLSQLQAEAASGGDGEIELAGLCCGGDSDTCSDRGAFRGRVVIVAEGLTG